MEIIIVQFIFAFVGSQVLFGFTVYSTNILKISSLLIGHFISLNRSVDNNFIHLKYLHLLSPPYLTSTLGCKGYIRKNVDNHLVIVNLLVFQGKWKSIDASLCFKLLNPCSA